MSGTSAPRKKIGKPAGDDPVLIALGGLLAERRRELGRLQQDVANAAGVSRSTLHTIEHGGTGVRWEKVGAVVRELGLTMNFVTEDGSPVLHQTTGTESTEGIIIGGSSAKEAKNAD